MRFKFVLTIDRQKSPLPILPVQYQYPVSCWIYKLIKTGNSEYKGWLQRNRFVAPSQVFPDFTFSNFLLKSRDYEVKRDRLMLLKDEIEMIFSFRSTVDATEYVEAVFMNQQFSLGDRKSRVFFQISRIEKLPVEEITGKMRFRTISPLLICQRNEDGEKASEPLQPGDDNYRETFLKELLNNYRRKNKNLSDDNIIENAAFNILNEPKEKQVLLKAGTPEEQRIKAYEMAFEIEANTALIERGYHAGFGIMNKKGFGCVEIMEEEENDPLYRI